jgi:ssDNA-binding Zn-finger/Zn-ribbon topoisomerase 1
MGVTDLNKYEEEKKKPKLVVCDDCQGEFILTQESIKTDSLEAKGEIIQITYFTCPHCNKLYKIKIDSIKTLQALKVYEMQMNLVTTKLQKGKVVTEANMNRLEKAKKNLAKEYGKLDELFSGSFYQK